MWLQKAEKEAAAAAVVQTTGADDKGKAPIPAQVTNGARNIKNLCCCQLPVCMAKFPPDTSILCAECTAQLRTLSSAGQCIKPELCSATQWCPKCSL